MTFSLNKYFLFTIFICIATFSFSQNEESDSLKYSVDDFTQLDAQNLSNLDFSKSLQKDIQYNPETGEYEIVTKLGDTVLNTDSMTQEEYERYSKNNNIKEYWKQRVDYEMNLARSVQEPELKVYLDTNKLKLFEVNPFGSFDVIAGFRGQNVQNPTLPIRQRKTGGLDFDMNIQMGINGNIADVVNFDATYNTETNFNFNKNLMKTGYKGKEDDILQELDFGNVSLPLRSSLIQGNQSLLGVKTKLQFGRLTSTLVLSQQESQQKGLTLEGGTQKEFFEIQADDYEENRHFFLAHYFRDQYEQNLKTLPAIATPYNITRLQVWVTNRNFQTTNVRQFVAFTDLGEPERIHSPLITPTSGANYAENESNSLFKSVSPTQDIRTPEKAIQYLTQQGYRESEDYQIVTARKLQENEYVFNRELGYISINRTLAPDEVLAVSFEYTDLQGNVRRVGEFSENVGLNGDVDNNRDKMLILKLLKPRAPRTDLPTWDLMMKNIYPLGAFQVDQQEFRLDVYYNDAGDGLKRYLPVEENEPIYKRPLIQVLGLDRFNASTIARPDGVFDFLPNYTIQTRNGKLIFPVLEPFGSNINNQLVDQADKDRFVYDELYDLTKAQAKLYPEYNRYSIKGSYRSELRDEISLGAFNIPRNSVIVRAGGRQLVEGTDYTIDYNLGRLKILNTALVNSGVPLDVRFENNLQLGFQSKRLVGSRFDYYVNRKLGLGGTFMNLRERPFTNKVNIGEDPISNTVLGFDVAYQSKSDWLTRAVDKIPLINTKEESSINFQAEVARFMPGHAKQIGNGTSGQVYIDDFEGSSSSYDLKFPPESWSISSVPQRFAGSQLIDNIKSNDQRAKISWYNIDPILNSDNTNRGRPRSIDAEKRSDVYARQVLEKEVFPNIVNEQRVTVPLTTFDVSYYPNERGPYNFSVDEIDKDGFLKSPEDKWGGVMRNITVTDFQAANVEFVEFWMMDPFINTADRPTNDKNKGKLVLNLGNISEDILSDGRMFFENGLPEPGQQAKLDRTNLGIIPTVLNINNAFAASQEGLLAQDVGFDGLSNDGERDFYKEYLDRVAATYGTSSGAYVNASRDPSADDFHNFLGEDYDEEELGIVERYKNFTNPHGNSSGSILNTGQYANNATNTPDSEDVNRDSSLDRTEAYYEYEVDLSPASLQVGQNFIVSKVATEVTLPNGSQEQVDWYQFKIPIANYTKAVNNIKGFQSIRFIRMYMTEFEQPTTLRFARLNLLRNQWRRYEYQLDNRNAPINTDVNFNVFPINIEENQNKQPFPYTLPPGIQREQIQGAANSFLRNEQSLAMNICSLPDGEGRAIYKLLDLDIRQFDKLQMYVHAEELIGEVTPVKDNELELFVRVGSDFSQNYYEYTQPLTISKLGQTDAFNIWPEENNVDIGLGKWIDLKRERNKSSANPTQPYLSADKKYSVLGTPDLGRSAFVMIGVKNVRDNGIAQCAEIWINELRVSGLNEKPGFAALASADIKLADFGDISLSGNMHTAGYGSIEQKIDQRYRDDLVDFGVSGNFNLDKLLPAKSTVRLPVFASYTKSTSLPQFNPYETDLRLKDSPDSIKNNLKEEVEIKTINFTNIRKERSRKKSDRKPKVYDIENLNLSYSYTEKNTNTAIIAREVDKTHYGALAYNFSPKPKPIRPFFRLVKEQKYLKWAKEFNVNLIPSSMNFRTDMTKRYQETALRDIQEPTQSLDPFFYKDWVWNRNYDLKWNLTNSINVNFQASNQSRVDQPEGRIDTQPKRDTIWKNVQNFGRNVLYNHSANATYKVPFSLVPILDFIQTDVSYSSTYQWLSAPQEIDPVTQRIRLNTRGNAIRNSQGIQVNSALDFTTLYSKSKFLEQYASVTRSRSRGSQDRSRSRTRDENKTDDKEKDDNKNKETTSGSGLGLLMKPLLSLKRLSINYTDQRGTYVPGFTPTPTSFGQNLAMNSPGWGFVFGGQFNRTWLEQAAQKNWITKDTTFSYQYLQDRTRQLTANASLQPVNNFNIDVNLNYSKTDNYSELFRNVGSLNSPEFSHLNPNRSGNYNISFISFKTLFEKRSPEKIPDVFKQFEKNRVLISNRLGDLNPNSVGSFPDNPEYRQGYGPYSPDVLIPSFLAAYTGKSASNVALNPFKVMPLPNWSLSYSGLTDLPFVAKKFSSIRLNHAYTSSYSINQFNSNLKYEGPEDYFLPTAFDELSNNYYAFYYIPQISITERFSPLAGLDMSMKNGLTMRVNYQKSRTLGMSLLDYQLSERTSTGFTIGAGYQTRNLTIPFKLFGEKRTLRNDIIFRLDYSLQDDIVTNYKLDQDISLPTRGAKTISLLPTIDYTINDRMNMQLYYDKRKSEPKTRSSYPVTNTRGGVKLSYTFSR